MRSVIVAILMSAALGVTATAQTNERQEAEAAMETCRSIAVAEVRQACMGAATSVLARLSRDRTEPPSSSAADAESIQQATANLEAERIRLETERRALAAEKEQIEQQRLELAELEEDAEESTKRDLSRFSPFSLERTRPPKIIPVSIVKITVDRRKIHRFFTSDGDILTQSHNDQKLHAPSSLPAAAKVVRSLSGARWLEFDERPNRRLKISLP